MQHVFEFIAIKKLTPEEIEFNKNPLAEKKLPITVHRFFNSETNRKSKVTNKIYKELEKQFDLKQANLEHFYLRQLR